MAKKVSYSKDTGKKVTGKKPKVKGYAKSAKKVKCMYPLY